MYEWSIAYIDQNPIHFNKILDMTSSRQEWPLQGKSDLCVNNLGQHPARARS